MSKEISEADVFEFIAARCRELGVDRLNMAFDSEFFKKEYIGARWNAPSGESCNEIFDSLAEVETWVDKMTKQHAPENVLELKRKAAAELLAEIAELEGKQPGDLLGARS